jgi:hypothetical protein
MAHHGPELSGLPKTERRDKLLVIELSLALCPRPEVVNITGTLGPQNA